MKNKKPRTIESTKENQIMSTKKKGKDLQKGDIISLTRSYRIIEIHSYDGCSEVKIKPIAGRQSLLDHEREFELL